MRLSFEHGRETEFNIVKQTLSDMDFFDREDYPVALPKGVTVRSGDAKIRSAIAAEFSEEPYLRAVRKFKDDFSPRAACISAALSSIGKPPGVLKIVLTRYGCYGSCQYPDRIIVRIGGDGLPDCSPADTPDLIPGFIVHEVMHLLLDPRAAKHTVGHWERERVIDLVCYSPPLEGVVDVGWQATYHGVESYVDPIFAKHGPRDLEGVFRELGELHHSSAEPKIC